MCIRDRYVVQECRDDGFVTQTYLIHHNPGNVNVVEDYGITRDALLVLVRIFGKVVSLEYQFEFFFAGATFEA